MFLLLDKPKGITSHDVVGKIRKISGERKVGHGGTLDPNATGLIIIAIGRASTKKLEMFTKGMDKTYEAEIILGEERNTDDVEGTVVRKSGKIPTKNDIKKVLQKFTGESWQVPPDFSAIKKGGKKAYELSRLGKNMDLKPRKIVIKSATLLEYNYPRIEAVFEVSSGTYIRAIARDLGRELGTYAYLNNLKRIKIGKFGLERAVDLDILNSSNWENHAIEI